MRLWLIISLLLCTAGAFAGSLKDPYPGSGGLILGTPSDQDVQSGRSVYTPGKLASLKVGVTTKQEVVALLGEPANWSTEPDGTSELGYDFVSTHEAFGLRKVLRASFTFDKNLVLFKIDAPDASE